MKPNLLPLFLTAGLLALVGCSSTPTRVDTGPIRARTFSFVDPGPKASPGYADNRQPIHAAIKDVIARNLAAKGATRTPSGGDVTVGYLLIVGNNATTTSINDYFGYASDAAGLHEKAHQAHMASKNPNYFEAGTLVIDVVDSKSFKLIKRGFATRQILRDLPADARAARLQEVVDEILRDLRFVP
jgi:hypothetical protein